MSKTFYGSLPCNLVALSILKEPYIYSMPILDTTLRNIISKVIKTNVLNILLDVYFLEYKIFVEASNYILLINIEAV